MNATAQITVLTKTCSACKETKAAAAFYASPSKRTGLSAYCKACDTRLKRERYVTRPPEVRAGIARKQRERRKLLGRERTREDGFQNHIKRKYGMTVEAAKALLNSQYGLCANRACRTELSLDVHGSASRSNRAVIDHDHKTGKVRGLLCHKCNTIEGMVEKNRNRIIGLAEYLMRTES